VARAFFDLYRTQAQEFPPESRDSFYERRLKAATLEIEAEIPSGAPDHVVRTVTENSRTLKFTNQGFEKE